MGVGPCVVVRITPPKMLHAGIENNQLEARLQSWQRQFSPASYNRAEVITWEVIERCFQILEDIVRGPLYVGFTHRNAPSSASPEKAAPISTHPWGDRAADPRRLDRRTLLF